MSTESAFVVLLIAFIIMTVTCIALLLLYTDTQGKLALERRRSEIYKEGVYQLYDVILRLQQLWHETVNGEHQA